VSEYSESFPFARFSAGCDLNFFDRLHPNRIEEPFMADPREKIGRIIEDAEPGCGAGLVNGIPKNRSKM